MWVVTFVPQEQQLQELVLFEIYLFSIGSTQEILAIKIKPIASRTYLGNIDKKLFCAVSSHIL